MNPSPIADKWDNRTLFRLLWPLVIEQLLAVMMGTVDTIMVSSVGEHAVSGVNIIDNINNLFVIAFTALATGGTVVCSQYIGRQDNKNASLASRQLVYIVTIVSLIITVIALILRRPVIRALYGNIEENVMNAAMVYFLITALSYPMMALYNACAALFRAAGNSKVPMMIALLVNVMHIGGNALFVYGLNMGVAGVGLSTLLSRIAAAIILLVMLIRNRRGPITLSGLFKVEIHPTMSRRILNIGIPTGLEQSMFQFGRLLTQRIFPYFGTSVIAANAVAAVVNSFSFMMGSAFSLALLTIVGQCIGAGDYEGAKKHTSKIIKLTWIMVIFTSALIFIFKKNLIGFFHLSPDAREAANLFITIHCVTTAVFWTFSWVLPSALRAAGDAKHVMMVGTISMWTVRVSASYLLAFVFKLGPAGVWLAMGGDFLVRGTCFIIRWSRGKWQKIKVISD